MKAIVYTEYGPPENLGLKEVEKPSPEPDEVLVRVQAASVNYSDWSLLRGKPFLIRMIAGGLLKPKITILGADIAGRVEAVGCKVSQFHPGDDVFGDISDSGWGGFADYVCTTENQLALKPSNVSFEEAATSAQAAVVALQGLRDQGKIQPGQKVLIIGASGGVGTFAVQIAKSFGAEVTGVCSTRNLDLVRSIGADRVIDYTKDDFAQNGKFYDLILATAGYRSIFDYERALDPEGIYVMSGGSMAQILQAGFLGPWISMKGGKKMSNLFVKSNQKDLDFIAKLLEGGKVTPVIDRCHSLSEVPEAIRYYGEGHSQGKIVVNMENHR